MNRNIIFAILLTLLVTALSVTSFAAPSNEIKAINQIPSSDHRISSLILVEGNPNTMSAHIKDGRIHIKDNLHTNREVRLKYYDLYNILNNFNGYTLGYTHVASDDTLTHKVVNVGSIDSHGYITLEMEFSEVIIDGFTGYTTQTYSSQSGNQSFSVPDGSSYDLNITNNQEGVYSINGYDWEYQLPYYQDTTAVFTDTQYEINNTNFPISVNTFNNISTDGNSLPIMNFTYSNETNIPFWVEYWNNESSFKLWTTTTSGIENLSLRMYYGGNDVLSSGSSIFDVGIIGSDDFEDSTLNTDIWQVTAGTPVISSGELQLLADTIWNKVDIAPPVVLELRDTKLYYSIGSANIVGFSTYTSQDERVHHYADNAGAHRINHHKSGGGSTYTQTDWSDNTYADFKIIWDSDTPSISWFEDGVESSGSPHTTANDIPTNALRIILQSTSSAAVNIDTIFIRKYAPVEPTYTIGTPQQVQGATNITALITGDSNTQAYQITQSRQFTLNPTGTTNNVNINTISTDYDVTITTYWTENTIKYSEIISDGYANTTIQFTPSFNITNGVLNSTYNAINFVDHDYNGELICLVDGVNYNGNASRSGNDVNVSIVNFDTSMHWINFSVAYNPVLDLYSPVDNAILNYTFPPLNHDVLLSWMNTTGTYKYEVYEGASIKRTGVVNTNSTTISLPAGYYTWISYGFDDIFNEYSTSSESFDFTISTNITYTNTTGVHGVVFDYLIGIETPLENAGISIWNDTFSSSTITGTDGYFSFTGLANSTYYLIAKKDRYYDSNTEVVTLLTNNMTEHNIRLIENTGTDYNKHYVKFILKSFFGTLYSDVLASVYIGDSSTVYLSDNTGTDGSVVFELTESQEYRITFIDETQNIDIEKIIMPSDTLYEIIVFGASIIPEDRTQDNILYTVEGIDIDTTQGYINATFTDTSGTTELAQLIIKDKSNLSVLYHFNTTDSSKEWSQIVDGGNASYIIEFKIDNTILSETLIVTRTIYFDSVVRVDLGLTNNWTYILIAVSLITVIALLSSMLNVEIMAVATVLTGWTMIYFGWLIAGMSTEEEITMYLMMLLATLIAFGSIIKKGENR